MNDTKIVKNDVNVPFDEKEARKNNVKKIKKGSVITFLSILTIFLIALCLFLYLDSTKVGTKALIENYNLSYDEEKAVIYEMVYSTFFNSGEEKFHVKNKVAIEIGNLKEVQKLEILKVSSVEYIIIDAESNDDNIESWLEVPGEGTFIVDLKKGEFIVDIERVHVFVRVPYPELTNVNIVYANVSKLLFEDDLLNGNYSVGEDLARQQLSDAELLIHKELSSNQNYYLNAQKVARSTIENLVKQLNPNVPDLKVEVEFY